MKYFNKKILIIIIISIILIIIACIYFFTHTDDTITVTSNDLFIENISNNSENKKITIHITGEINNPGIVYLNSDSRIIDAINAAGGSTDIADLNKINLAYPLQDGQKIYVPSIYDEDISNYITNSAGNNVLDDENNISTININTATQSELESLPGIGESTAKKIIDYRNQNGKFKQIEDIMNVSGIGESKFNNIKDKISV